MIYWLQNRKDNISHLQSMDIFNFMFEFEISGRDDAHTLRKNSEFVENK